MTSDTEVSDSDLHVAVRYGDLKEVQCSLSTGLSPNKIGLYQWSPLHEAASCGYTAIITHLLKHGGDPNLPDNLCSNTSVHYAAQEGHATCLSLLLEAGGDYSIKNDEGESALDLATKACQRIIEKKRVEKLIRLPLSEAKQDANDRYKRIDHTEHIKESSPHDRTSTPTGYHNSPSISLNDDGMITSADIRENDRIDRLKAWAPQITKPDLGTMGMLHISFEYNSKKNYIKIRLWKLTGLMVSQTHSSMINTLYIKSTFVPDVNKNSKRRSEEIRVSSLIGSASNSVSTTRNRHYTTSSGTEVLFETITFKFSRPLVYEQVTPEVIRDKVVYIQVSLKQKYTQKTYVIADLTIPLSIAVTKIVKESFPLRICKHTKLPDSMMILPDIKIDMSTASDPNLRRGSPALSIPYSTRPASDVNLREIMSLSSHSASISIDIPSDEEREIINEGPSHIRVEPLKPVSEVTIPMPGRMCSDSSSDEEGLSSVKVETVASVNPVEIKSTSLGDQPVTITVTNDSDSLSDDDVKPKKRKNKLKKFIHKVKTTTDKVVMLEHGLATQGFVNQGFLNGEKLQFYRNQGPPHRDSVTKLDESNNKPSRHKPKTADRVTNHHKASSLLSSPLDGAGEVILSLGDLELEDMDQPAAVHTACKIKHDENIV